jgi:hypothetical protein
MRSLLAILAIVAFAVPAFAGANPDVYAYISFDPAGDETATQVTPAPYTTVSAYVCLGGIEGGMTTVSFAMNDVLGQCPGVMGTQAFVNLLPGNLAIGDAFVGGVTVASTECMMGPVVVVGRVDCFFLAGDCCFEILDHVDYPRWVVDCADPGLVDYYCVKSHGIVGAGQCVTPVDDPCPQASPVEDATWGGIKAMYN